MAFNNKKYIQKTQHKINKLAGLLIISLASGALISCNGGSSTTSGTPNYPDGESTVNIYNAVAGPVSYQQIDVWFQTKGQAIYSNNSSQLKGAAKGCGNVMNNTGTGLGIVSALVSFIPVVGPGLAAATAVGGAVASADGAAHASSCQALEFQQMQQSLASQELQITALQQALQTTDNQIWNAITNNSYANLTLSYSLFKDSIQTVNNAVKSIMSKSNLWNQNTFQPNPYTSVADYISQNQGKGFQTATNQFINGTTGQLALAINRLTGINTVNESGPAGKVLPTIYFDPTATVVSLYYSMYNATMDSLTTQLQDTSKNPNIVKLINDYNNAIIAIYLQSVNAVQATYDLGFEINQINYQAYSYYESKPQLAGEMGNNDNYLGRLLNTPGTYYNPVTNGIAYQNVESQKAQYNNAQYQLSIYTASILNMLFQTTMGYIITDNPQGSQNFPDTATFTITNPYNGTKKTGESINYTKLIGARLPKDSFKTPRTIIYDTYLNAVANTGQQLETELLAAESSAGANFSFYQFPLINIAQLSNLLENYNTSTSDASLMNFLQSNKAIIPTIYATSNNNNPPVENSIASGATLQPYSLNTALSSEYPTLMGNVTNNLQACNGYPVGSVPGYNLYIYKPMRGTPSLGTVNKEYLMCGNWSTSNMPTQVTNTNTQEVTTYYPGLAPTYNSDTANTQIVYSNLISNSPTNNNTGLSLAECLFEDNCGTFPSSGNTITMLNFNSQNWGSNNTMNNLQQGESLSAVFTGGMSGNYPTNISNEQSVSNLAAAQITLPDGFIAPIVLVNTNINGWQGNYIGIGYNPNVANVTIESLPMLNGESNIGPGSINSWGVAPSNTTASYSGNNSYFFQIPAININGNTIMMNSNTTPGGGAAYIAINPTNCPAWLGAFSTSSTLLPAGYYAISSYQIGNFVCNLPTYNGFFGN